MQGNYFITTDNAGNKRAIVYQKLWVEKDDETAPETPYTLYGLVGSTVHAVATFEDQHAANRELLTRCGVQEENAEKK